MNDIQLFKPNELINFVSQLELSRNARHLFNYFLQYAQQQIKFEGYQGNTFRINVTQLNTTASIKHKDYKDLEKSLLRLISPIIIRDNPKQVTIFSAVRKVRIDYSTGEYEFMLEDEILQLLANNNYFTKLNLQEFNPLGKHSIVIFEFLKRYETAPKIPLLLVEDLRKMTNTQDRKTYDNFSHIKNNILDVAQEEINSLTSYNVEYTPIKAKAYRRPKVTAIQFYFSKKTENNQEVIDVQATDNNSVITPKIQDTSIPKEPKYMNANELYTVFANCFNGLSWADFCGATYFYDNYTIIAFAYWARTQTHKYNKELFTQYLIDRVISPKYENYRYRAMQLSEINIRKYLFDLNPNKQIADQGFQAFCELYYYKQPFDQLSLILSKSLQHNAVGAYDFFLKAYEEEKHHFQA